MHPWGIILLYDSQAKRAAVTIARSAAVTTSATTSTMMKNLGEAMTVYVWNSEKNMLEVELN